MSLRRTSLAAALAALVALAGCTSDDDPSGSVDTASPTADGATDESTAPSTDDTPSAPGGTPSTALPTDDLGEVGAPSPPATPGPDSPADDDDQDDGGTRPAAVALSFDGRRVPTSEVCSGVDGAVRASTPGEVTIFLVREEGLAMRYLAEGTEAESASVDVQEVGATTVYTTVFEDEDVPRIEVAMEVTDTSDLPDCA